MKKLEPPGNDTASADIAAGVGMFTQDGTLSGEVPSPADTQAILDLYAAYDAQAGQWSDALNAEDLSEALIASIRHAYGKTHPNGRLAHLREQLLDQDQLCPACGINFCTTLDHFLPKESIGVFAIYSRNLIPLCAECNHKKHAHLGHDPSEQFLHAYLEDFPAQAFLTAHIEIDDARMVVTFAPDAGAGLSLAFRQRLEFQLEKLKLQERYSREINVYLASQSTNWPDLFEVKGAEGIVFHLQRQAENEALYHHQNDWRAVLCRALSQSEDFCGGGFLKIFPPP